MKFSRLSLLWKILLPTSLVMTLSFAVAGWLIQRDVVRASYASVEQEATASFQAYESLWKARANRLGAISAILSAMSDVRAAFGTKDAATIRDTAGELWSRVSNEDAFFLVADGQGRVVASFGQPGSFAPNDDLPMVRAARARFPSQAAGFVQKGDELFQVVVTPVYVQSPAGAVLLNALVAGYRVDAAVAQTLKDSTGGSEYLFVSRNRVVTSTLAPSVTAAVAPQLLSDSTEIPDYLALPTPLLDISGAPLGQLFILRSLAAARHRLAALRREIVALWLLALVAALLTMYLVARKIMQPVAELDRAAAEIAKQNYDYRIDVGSQDELGRLAGTFRSMCESIRQARQELIRQERISTIGRLSTSIVHDLRNPLAAIYAGAEMMMDSDLPQETTRRLARNIYRASRGIQDMLQQLLDVARGGSGGSELCSLREVISAAWNTVAPSAEERGIALDCEVAEDLVCPMERARMERVFANLFENAIKAMRSGGAISVRAEAGSEDVMVRLEDTGPGISASLRGRLFQPFVSAGKKNGLGLGLALSRQTLLDHGGDLWADDGAGRDSKGRDPNSRDSNSPNTQSPDTQRRENAGALFWLRLPKNRSGVMHEAAARNGDAGIHERSPSLPRRE
jgi:signal transduction histidine kinase